MTDRELMQQALDAMLNNPDDISDEMFKSIKALKERLAQPQASPAESGLAEKVPVKNTLLEQTLGKVWDEMPHADYQKEMEHEPGVKLDASAPLVVQPHPAFKKWQGLSPFDKTLLRTTHAPLKPVYYDRVNDHSVCAEVVTDWDKFFTEIESKLRENNNA